MALALCLAGALTPADAAPATPVPNRSEVGSSRALVGWLDIVWGDDWTGQNPSQTRYTLTTAEGAVVPLQPAASIPFETLLDLRGRLVTAEGQFIGPSASAPSGRFYARALDESSALATPEAVALTGSQPWISIMCKFADVSTEPNPPSYFQSMYSNTYPGLDHYWREQSYDLMNVAGSGAPNLWVTLPYDRSYYVTSGGAYLTQMVYDCTEAANPYVYYPSYVGINMMFNGEQELVRHVAATVGLPENHRA
jgi:hypothetical protein